MPVEFKHQQKHHFWLQQNLKSMVTTKFEKYYTIMARSKEHAIKKFEDGEWDFDDYEEDYGEYNERIDEVEEQDIFDQKQLVLEGVL